MILRPLVLGAALAAAGCLSCPPSSPERPTDAAANHDIFQFRQGIPLDGWEVEDDNVMGGLSRGRLVVNEAGNALFTGDISLDNNGGFSSIQYDFASLDVSGYQALCLGLRGDGKRYQVRVESAPRARHAYAFDFQTDGNWQVIEIPFRQMEAIRHGDRLDLPNYPGETMTRIQILAGEGRAESFQLEIDRIWLK